LVFMLISVVVFLLLMKIIQEINQEDRNDF
jgi:hypothetical protein